MKKGRRFLACILASLLVIILLPPKVVFAAPTALDLDDGPIAITATGYSQGGKPEIPHTDGYVITNTTPTTNTIQVLSGTHAITLNNVSTTLVSTTALIDESCAFSIQGGTVNLTLTGTNTLVSSRGFAGIYVAEGTSLTIGGDGSLTATGGSGTSSSSTPYAAGAGIGGNGYNPGSTFGTITVNSGTVTATGGPTDTTLAALTWGAGAGIGGGGETVGYPASKGEIIINDGIVNATGGDGLSTSETSGGAGIGSGGRNETPQYHTNQITITINGGTITATGKADGAGIGGGNKKNSGPILINGGHITAVGGHEISSEFWGGAGIGGGDSSFADDITITGNAIVDATGGGTAAGIGGGQGGGVAKTSTANAGLDVIGSATITISGNAQVTARASTKHARGSAGIGGGSSYYDKGPGGNVRIEDHAKVIAYSEIDGQAIGVARYYDFSITDPGYDNTLYIEDTATIMLFNHASSTVALSVAAYPATVAGSGAPYIVAYTLPTGATPSRRRVPRKTPPRPTPIPGSTPERQGTTPLMSMTAARCWTP